MFYVHTYLWYIDIKVGINLSIYTCYTFLEMGDQVRYDCEVTIDKFYKNIYHIYMGALMVYVDTLLIAQPTQPHPVTMELPSLNLLM